MNREKSLGEGKRRGPVPSARPNSGRGIQISQGVRVQGGPVEKRGYGKAQLGRIKQCRLPEKSRQRPEDEDGNLGKKVVARLIWQATRDL